MRQGSNGPTTPPIKRKVLAYITHGSGLLVFRQPQHPEAGIQVPGGTVEQDEPPDIAALREAREETGLLNLSLVRFLGSTDYDCRPHGKQEIHERHYFHLRCAGTPAETWDHWEEHPSEGETCRILFRFGWLSLPDGVPALISDMDEMLPALVADLDL